MLTRYVNTASGGGDGTTNGTGTGGTNAFATLRAAIDAIGASLSDAMTIYCSGTAADTGNVDQTPWDFTTTAANYLRIVGDNTTGLWDTSKYRITATNTNGIYSNSSAHVRIENVQVQVTVTNAGGYIGIKTTNSNQTANDTDMRVSNCIVKAVQTSGTVTGYETRPYGGSGGKAGIWNCMAIDCNYGFGGDTTYGKVYNCGAYDCTYGFVADAAWIAKNCLSKGATIGFVGTFAAASNYNVEDDGNGAPGANSDSGSTFTFVNAGADNFHLASNDAGAKDQGTDLSGDADFPFSNDIDGQTRSGTWDVGPDEYQVSNTTVTPTKGGLALGGKVAWLNPQYLRPASTTASGSWTATGAASLHAAIGEAASSDSEYVTSAVDPTDDTCEVALGTGTDPETGDGHCVRYRIKATGTQNLTVQLREGASTTIAEFTHTPAPTVWTTYSQWLTTAQANSITDYTALRLKFIAP